MYQQKLAPVFPSFFMLFFEILNFHDISITLKLLSFFQGLPGILETLILCYKVSLDYICFSDTKQSNYMK